MLPIPKAPPPVFFVGPAVFIWVWLTPTATSLEADIRIPIDIDDDIRQKRSCATEYPGLPKCDPDRFDYYATAREACQSCPGNSPGCLPCNESFTDELNWLIVTDGLGGTVSHYTCKKGRRACHNSVFCGSCCVEESEYVVRKYEGCKCARRG